LSNTALLFPLNINKLLFFAKKITPGLPQITLFFFPQAIVDDKGLFFQVRVDRGSFKPHYPPLKDGYFILIEIDLSFSPREKFLSDDQVSSLTSFASFSPFLPPSGLQAWDLRMLSFFFFFDGHGSLSADGVCTLRASPLPFSIKRSRLF